MGQESEGQYIWKEKIAFGLALLVATVWLVLSSFLSIGASNIASYLIGVALFAVSFLLLYRFLPKKIGGTQSKELSETAYRLVCVGLFCLFVVVLLLAFFQASVISGGQAAMEWGFNALFIAVFAVGTAILVSVYVLSRKGRLHISSKLLNVLWWISVAGILLFVAWWAYVPNSLNYMWDYEAYWFSAFAAVRNIPISPETTSYYGHYGLLMAPFFYLLGGFSPVRVGLLLSLESVAMMLALCYILYQVCSSFLWRFLGLFAFLDYFCTLSTVEGQMTPHRVIFPVFLLAFGVFYLKNKERYAKKFHIICLTAGYFVAILGLIWSTDSGIVGIIAWCALHFYVIFTNRRLGWKDVLNFAKIVGCGIASFVLAWQLTSVLNMTVWKGEAISLPLFMAPLSVPDLFNPGKIPPEEKKMDTKQASSISSEANAAVADAPIAKQAAPQKSAKPNQDAGYVISLQLDLVRAWTPWGAILVLFLFFLAKGFSNTSFFTTSPKFYWKNGFAFLCAVLGTLMLVYFFNRVYYYNFFTVYFFVVLLLALAGEMAAHGAKKQTKQRHFHKAFYSTGAVCFGLCLLVTISFSAGRLPIQARKIAACQKADVMSVFFQELSDRIPDGENIRFVGPSATYCNAALNLTNDQIIWHPWVNEPRIPQFPMDATLMVTENAYHRILQNVDFFSSLIDNVFYLDDTFRLNYNNVGYEESKDFFVYKQMSSKENEIS